MRRAFSFSCFVLVVVASACAGPKPAESVSGAPSATPSAAASASVSSSVSTTTVAGMPGSRARYAFFPSDSWTARDVIELTKDTMLFVGNGGERWTSKQVTNADGDVQSLLVSAATFAPEDLVAARRIADGSFVFLGASGAIYTAKEALGELGSKRMPPEPMRAVSAGKSSLVGITLKNGLLRSVDWGSTWSSVAMPPHDRVLHQIQMTLRGEGIVLGSPQRLFATIDDGATFVKIASTGAGAQRLALGKKDETLVAGSGVVKDKGTDGAWSTRTGYLGAVLKRGSDGAPKLEPIDPLPTASRRLDLPTGHLYLTYANAIADGRGALVGNRHFEVLPDDSEDMALRLATYELGKGSKATPIAPKLSQCTDTLLAAEGNVVVVGCAKDEPTAQPPGAMITLVRSTDGGATFAPFGKLNWSLEASYRRMWVTAKGAVVLEGACLAPRPADCGTSGPIVRAGNGQAWKSALPAGTTPPVHFQAVASTSDDRIYAVGQSDETSLGLYVSKDGGKIFAFHPFAGPDDPIQPRDVIELVVDEKTKRVTVFTDDPISRWTTSDDGATFAVKQLPISASAVSIVGTRGLAMSESKAYETLDTGVTWTEVPAPKRRDNEATALKCSTDGCILGERAARIGWELASPADVKPVAETPPVAASIKPNVFAPAMKCVASGDPITFASPELPIAAPTASIAWMALTRDVTHAAVSVTMSKRDPAKKVGLVTQEVVLLAPVTSPANVATWDSIRSEGAIAIRQQIGAGSKDMEVAWWDAATNAVHRTTLKGVAVTEPAMHQKQPNGTMKAKVMAWLVPGAGALVRPHLSKTNDELWSITDAGKATRLTLPGGWPSMPLVTFRDGARTLLVGTTTDYYGARQTLIGALKETGPTPLTMRWWGMWPKSEGRYDGPKVFAASAGATPYLISTHRGDAEIPPRNWGFSLEGDALDPPNALMVPTSKDLATMKACDGASAGRARVELPWINGGRRPIVVDDGKSPRVLATHDTIGRWDPKGSCVSAQVASNWNGVSTWVAFISFDDLSRGTYFKEAFVKGLKTIEARTLACTLAPELPFPKELKSAKGFTE